jgi:DnaJ family protein A protein 2
VFARESEQQPDIIPGDVIIILRQAPHKRFKRVGNNLFTEMTLTLEEALLGFKKKMVHLDGRVIEIRSELNEIIQPFSWKIIEEEGMPINGNPSETG